MMMCDIPRTNEDERWDRKVEAAYLFCTHTNAWLHSHTEDKVADTLSLSDDLFRQTRIFHDNLFARNQRNQFIMYVYLAQTIIIKKKQQLQ